MKRHRQQFVLLELFLLIGIFSVSALLPACSNTQSPAAASLNAALPTATPGTSPTATPNASATPSPTPTPTPSPTPNTPDFFNVSTTFASPVYSVTHAVSSWSAPCSMDVNTSATNSKDIICYTEIANLDLHAQPMSFVYTAPVNGCAYIASRPNWFFQYQPGTGPSTYSYTYNTNTNTYSSVVGAGLSVMTNPTSGQQILVCQYDYSNNVPAGPNCCSGTYAATITTVSVSNGVTTSTTVTNTGAWPGKPGNCAAGPAAFSTTVPQIPRDTVYNYPETLIESAYFGFTHSFAIAPPISRTNSTNVSAANYTSTPGAPPIPLAAPAQLYNEFDCLDPAYAIIGRIRLMVRKWNLESELLKGAAGNPALNGTSDGLPAPYDDFFSWDEIVSDTTDFPIVYPGANL